MSAASDSRRALVLAAALLPAFAGAAAGQPQWTDENFEQWVFNRGGGPNQNAAAARKRRNALHVWTTRLVASASAITVIAPPVKSMTATGRGDSDNWGAAVADVARLNRAALNFAPSTAIAMLQYKAAEAGIACDVQEDKAPSLAVGAALKTATKKIRSLAKRTKRALTEGAHEH